MVDSVVKFGGGILAHPAHFDTALETIATAARERRLLVVPGGGPFADAVRAVDRRLPLSNHAAHWMAILAMDQYAYLIASRLAGAVVVTQPHEIGVSLDANHVPVLAPSRWLREADPLPHSWDVTSDSIAAWVTGEVGARRLVLVKPPGAALRQARQSAATDLGGTAQNAAVDREVVDAYFPRVLPTHVTSVVVDADDAGALHAALHVRP